MCAHFVSDSRCCARGVNYQQLAGGGAYSMIFRLPCVELSNRQGEVARECNNYQPVADPATEQQPRRELCRQSDIVSA